MEKSEAQIAIETPKHLRTIRQREIIFGDCNPNRQYEAYISRAQELVRRLDEGLPLSKADTKAAKGYKKNGIEIRGRADMGMGAGEGMTPRFPKTQT